MKLAVVGSRDWQDVKLIETKLDAIRKKYKIHQIISGGAKGVDTIAVGFAKFYKIPYKEFLADWVTYGRSAGFRRNADIIEACDQCIAFWDGISKGTKHSIDIAKKLGKLLAVYGKDGTEIKTV